jgi:hypothetical protein
MIILIGFWGQLSAADGASPKLKRPTATSVVSRLPINLFIFVSPHFMISLILLCLPPYPKHHPGGITARESGVDIVSSSQTNLIKAEVATVTIHEVQC